MTDRLAIALAQIDPTVGDVPGNAGKVRDARAEAAARDADLVVFPELVLSGCPPEDLVAKPFFVAAIRSAVEQLAAETADGGPALLVAAPWVEGDRARNAALLLERGRIAAARYQHGFGGPDHDPLDGARWFSAGPVPGPVNFRDVRLGVLVGADMATPDVAEALGECGAEILLVPGASPFDTDAMDRRLNLAVARVTETELPLVCVNAVGGQDELVFDGASFALGADRTLVAQAVRWREQVVITRWQRGDAGWACVHGEVARPDDALESVYQAMTLGLADHVRKNGFPGVLIGLSGDAGSALSAAVAVDALGAGRVHCVTMPAPDTPRESLDDAAEVTELLGVRLDEIAIEPAMQAFARMLDPAFAGLDPDHAEISIRSRARGTTLMALSDKFGALVLATADKSAMSVGDATLHGDMCGGYSVLKDVYRTTVHELCHWRNANLPADALGPAGRVVPERVLTKLPTVEFGSGPADRDALASCDVLDDILRCLIEQDLGVPDIVARGHSREVVDRVWRMLAEAEHKRRQAPPGVGITRRGFGRGRRYPVTNGFTSLI